MCHILWETTEKQLVKEMPGGKIMKAGRASECVYIQMWKWRERYYWLTLSVKDHGRITQCYPLPAHMLLLPFLVCKYCWKSSQCMRVISDIWNSMMINYVLCTSQTIKMISHLLTSFLVQMLWQKDAFQTFFSLLSLVWIFNKSNIWA